MPRGLRRRDSGDTTEPGTDRARLPAERGARRGIYATDLKIRAPAASTDSLKLLAANRVDMSVVDIHDLGLAREAGSDVVGVGALVQRPLAASSLAPATSPPARPSRGSGWACTGLPSDDAVLRAVMENDGGELRQGEKITIGFSAVPSLIAGKVDAVVAFWNAEGVALRQRGLKTARVPAWTTTARRATPSWSSS
jgi:NitT/TauT family transport system substrate-binding protein/putative hydroxymethylpyrimidine transport system substrate-binding protein